MHGGCKKLTVIPEDWNEQRRLFGFPERLDRVRKFADCFGNLAGEFSYNHDEFPGREIIEARNAVYERPCLNHESGILGGYLDFSLESRYENTFIGTDLFRAAREHMTKHGVYQKAKIYYEKNCLFISSCRKQLIENMRRLRNLAGFDYLGGIDTHWHLIGYPCGIFNEFYEEKYGESIADVRRYCGESVLLCSAGNLRNRQAGTRFSEDIEFSCFEAQTLSGAELEWVFETDKHQVMASGKCAAPVLQPGNVTTVGHIEFTLPECETGLSAVLKVTLHAGDKIWDNLWNFWVFSAEEFTTSEHVRITNILDTDTVEFLKDGGAVLLTDHFPGTANPENFRSHTSGRSLGHAGALFNPHPVWEKFPHSGFLDWQFFPMMRNSRSLLYDDSMPEFKPLFELIPSFKMVKHKSMLSEFIVGKGRLMISGLNFDISDPGARYMLRAVVEYLEKGNYVSAPCWDPENLMLCAANSGKTGNCGQKIDAGGRPIG